MREAVIVLPRVHKDATEYLRTELLEAFGGYTEHEADGVWRDPADRKVYVDHNSIFTIGADEDNTGLDMLTIRNLAMFAGQKAGQISVYVRGFDGAVEFVNCVRVSAKYEDMAHARAD